MTKFCPRIDQLFGATNAVITTFDQNDQLFLGLKIKYSMLYIRVISTRIPINSWSFWSVLTAARVKRGQKLDKVGHAFGQ